MTYGPDLAYIHHAGFGELVRGATPGLLAALHKSGIYSGSIIDLGCGSGLWARQLSRHGYAVSGVDASASMIRIARRVAPRASFRKSSIYDLELPPCDGVTALGEILSYLPRNPKSAKLRKLLGRVSRALRPGGLFIFDVVVTGKIPMTYRTWRSGKDWAVLFDVSEDREQQLLCRGITTFTRVGRAYRRSHEQHVLRIYRPAALVVELREAGFSVKTSRRYGKYELAKRRMAFFARKT